MADETTTPADNSSVNATINAVAGLAQAIPVYQDALQPAAKEVGKSLEVVAKTIGIALAPLKAVVWGYEQIEKFLTDSLSKKLENTPEEDIITPPANVAGPAVEALRFTGEKDELREMYANLIANAMDKKTTNNAHPSFVEFIKSLTTDEALILKELEKKPTNPILAIKLHHLDDTNNFSEQKLHFNLIARNANLNSSRNSDLIGGYLDNFARMGLIEISYNLFLGNDNEYDELINYFEFEKLRFQSLFPHRNASFMKGIIRVTNLGRLFIESVVKDKTH